jgi:hypothetical protein
LRCGRCGNDNAEANRFCGMCGATLTARPQSAGQSPSAAPTGNIAQPRQPSIQAAPQTSNVALKSVDATATQPRPVPLVPSNPEPRREAAITGPSFLGLNVTTGSDGGVYRDRHDSATGHAPLYGSSSSVDYLLEDEEEPKSGAGKIILVVALALAVGFGYLRWKRGGFEWLSGQDKKAAVVAPTPDSAQSAPDSGGATATPPTTSSAAPAPTASAPVTPVPTDGAAANPPNSPSTTASSAPPTSAPNAAIPDANPPATAAATPSGSGGTADASPPSASDSDQQSDEEVPSAPTKPVTRKPFTAKPSAAKPVATVPNNSVVEAERYIYGRGVGQDCDRGLRLLKPAAEQSNPKAMISLGALYSTGTCAPRDLPTAYRWFAMALHKQPDNQVLQDDLQRLWSQMTQPERQLAIKLSQ